MTETADIAAPAEAAEAPKGVVRTLRFEVVWPGWREADLHALWKRIWSAQDDLRAAANRTISALYQLKLGAIPWPEGEAKRGKASGTVRKTPLRSLVYQALSGSWQPFGAPMYVPSAEENRVASHALLGLAGTLYTRIQSDWVDIQHGQKSLPTFRSLPIESPYVTVDKELGTFTVALWSGRGGAVTLRPRKLDHRMWSSIRGAVKFGGARLIWDKPPGRKGRWMLAVAVEAPAKDRSSGELVCAVRLGMATTCTLAYGVLATGKVARFTDSIDIPSSVWRAVRRVETERNERLQFGRLDHGARAGRGRERKLRAIEPLRDQVQRVTDTAIRQTAAAVVASAIRRGAKMLALPDLARWSVASEMDRTEDMPEGDRAAHRRWYLRWHQGGLREKITQAAEREGLTVVAVAVAGAGTTCSECGSTERGKRVERRWECGCGCKLSTEVNTAKVLAGRALVAG